MALKLQNKNPSYLSLVLVIVLLVASIASITVYTREGSGGMLHNVQSAFHSVFAPIEFIGSNAGGIVDSTGEAISDAAATEESLSELRQRVEELTELVTQGEEFRLENERLQGLLNLKDTYTIEGITGRVIGRSTDAWNQTITIDIGSSSGVEEGLTVLGPTGVVGQVLSVSEGSATVRLLSDPKSGAAAMVQSSRADGVVRGSLSGILYLENVSADIELSPGDVVLTSGLGGSYTKGLLIGTIVRIDGNAKDGTRQVVITPNEHAAVLEEVTVVFSAKEAIPNIASTQQLDKPDDANNADDANNDDQQGSSSSSSSSQSTSSNTQDGER